MRHSTTVLVPTLMLLAACTPPAPPSHTASYGANSVVTTTANDTLISATVEVAGLAAPIEQATLSTRLMGPVTEVLVHEGDQVRAGQALLRVDTRDLVAKEEQVQAALGAAESQFAEAERYARRIRALYADSAAPKAMLDGAEAGLTQASAGLAQAAGARRELSTIAGHGTIRAPFAGVVTRRFVDPGAFAAPGAPLVTVQNPAVLRITVNVSPDLARGISRRRTIEARIEGVSALAIVEGVVPAPGGGLYVINALVDDRGGRYASGGAAVLLVPRGTRRAVLVPESSILRQGDLTGVRVVGSGAPTLRWVRLGGARGDQVEVLSGLQGGEQLQVTDYSEGE